MTRFRQFLVGIGVVAALGSPAAAQDYLGSYVAYIGADDLYNSSGVRLTEPWQVLRQDRANYHRFNIAQQGDEWDPFFGSYDNRAAMEQMVMRGRIEPAAARDILAGGAKVVVTVYGQNGIGTSVNVDVYR